MNGINRVLKYYCTQVDTTSEASKILAANWMNRKITQANQNNQELISNLKKICIENFNGTMLACTASWANEYYLPTAIRWYKKAGFDCAMGLAMCMYIINNGTGITSHGDSLPGKLAGISDQLAKCKFVANSWRLGNSKQAFIKNYERIKHMWTTFCAAGDITLTGSYNWAQWNHSGRPF